MSNYKEIIERANTAIQEAYESSFSLFLDEPTRNEITAFTLEVMNLALYNAFQADNVVRIVDKVWGVARNRDFMMSVTVGFHIRLAASMPEYEALVDLLSVSISQSVNGDSTVPVDVRKRLATTDDVKACLLADKWIVTLVMINQFMSLKRTRQLNSAGSAVKGN